ncbi:hypothetical protein A0H81_06552 [Grifola frondosa]|uniref:AC transposase n=1 Tax=Grifola frondosa TaxID=5627 RepID=A0A1C7MC43_GRIFR|nr:hypothetical protein A0H81_06552 [Grifola frondosa]
MMRKMAAPKIALLSIKQLKRRVSKTSKQPRREATQPDEVDDNGMLKDVEVQEITTLQLTQDEHRHDIDHFFNQLYMKIGANGMEKGHRDRKHCKLRVTIVNEVMMLWHHLEAKHPATYCKWAQKHDFEFRLPGDVKKWKDAMKRCIIAYSEQVFREAAIEWLIATDQPISALEHPKFKAMINIASRVTDGVKIPSRKVACKEILCLFDAQMEGLRKRLNSENATGEVSLTCDAWQAANIDTYFAVTAHWIDKVMPNVWELRNTLLSFTCLNSAHNGHRLGQALYKIVDWVGIAHKHVNTFVYEIGCEEKNLVKRCKIDDLKLSKQEWDRVKLFLNLLGHADNGQQSFSSK